MLEETPRRPWKEASDLLAYLLIAVVLAIGGLLVLDHQLNRPGGTDAAGRVHSGLTPAAPAAAVGSPGAPAAEPAAPVAATQGWSDTGGRLPPAIGVGAEEPATKAEPTPVRPDDNVSSLLPARFEPQAPAASPTRQEFLAAAPASGNRAAQCRYHERELERIDSVMRGNFRPSSHNPLMERRRIHEEGRRSYCF